MPKQIHVISAKDSWTIVLSEKKWHFETNISLQIQKAIDELSMLLLQCYYKIV